MQTHMIPGIDQLRTSANTIDRTMPRNLIHLVRQASQRQQPSDLPRSLPSLHEPVQTFPAVS